jgi:hypothetical protein
MTALDPKVCIVLTQPLSAQRVVESLRTEFPEDVLLIGGAAGRQELDGRMPTYQLLNDTISTVGVAVLVLAGPVAASSAVGTGWRKLGPSGQVTASRYGALLEIDGKPAANWASAYLDLVRVRTLGNPLAIRDPGTDSWYLWVILGSDESGALVVPGEVPVGATVQLTTTNPDDMLASTAEAVRRARDAYKGKDPPTAALIFSCAVRKYLLGSRTDRELEYVRSELADSVAIAGMYCIGEIAPSGSESASHFLNDTFVTLLLGT